VKDLAATDSAGIIAIGPARASLDGQVVLGSFTRILSTLYKVVDLK
jgi:hypothetical protein